MEKSFTIMNNLINMLKVWKNFFIVIVVVQYATEASQDVCPSTCECFGAIVDCSGNGLNKVPDDLPSWVQHLNLNKNPRLALNNDSLVNFHDLKKLDICNLHLEKVPDLGYIPTLEEIDFSGNRINNVSSAWDENLPNVHTLSFIKNHIQHLDFSQVEPLPLRKIDFKSNSISTISTSLSSSLSTLVELRLGRNEIDDHAFRNLSTLFIHMSNLKQLDLNRNLLQNPKGLIFNNLTSLTVLKLKRNKIIELSAGVFYGLKSLVTLRLDNNTNITEINNGWLFDQEVLKVLSLSHNNIGQIKENAWDVAKKISTLDLNFNQLGCRHSEPNFNGLKNLQELFLSHNCFQKIDERTFAELTKLKKLDLSHNKLQGSIEYSTGAFDALQSLMNLNLAYNNIETIDVNIFKFLHSLVTLDLSGNIIKTLPSNPFRNLIKLKNLSLNSSSLVCDCSLQWMPEFLRTRLLSTTKFSCGFPEALKGRPIVKLKKRNLICDDSAQPIISEFPKNQTVLYGNNMTLECVAKIGGDNPSFTWTKNNKVLEPFHVKTFMNYEEDDSTMIVSQFYVANVTHDHAGTYQCIARNTFGPSYSPPAKVIVHRFPYFITKPSSVEIREGGVVNIACTASGYPAPLILLSKKGDGDFPSSREKRLFFSENVYFIKPVKPRDDGIYVCTARNAAGSINVTARVSVIHTPTFSRPAQNQASTLGQSIALECQGTGQPKPKVTWYKESRLVVSDRNHILLEEGQYLLLLNVQRADIGTYLCELTNRLGTQRRKINLSLKQDVLFPAITGLIVMIIVICIVLTSFLWVIIIYHMRKKTRGNNNKNNGSQAKSYPDNEIRSGFDHLLQSPNLLPKLHNNALTPTTHPFTPVAQDSGSEHSSGKDSGVGVGDSHQRSNEDLQREPRQRKSLALYPEFSNGTSHQGQSSLSRAVIDEMRPRLSTFSHQQLDQSRSYNPTYASLRRGSTSRLLAVPSPVTPGGGLGMNSLPRHAYRNHSKYSIPVQDTASLSRRKPSLSKFVDSPRSVEDQQANDEATEPLSGSPPSDEPITIAPNFYSFRSDKELPPLLSNGVHLLPS